MTVSHHDSSSVNTTSICIFTFIFFVFFIFCAIFTYLKVKDVTYKEYSTRIVSDDDEHELVKKVVKTDTCPVGKVCLTKDEYKSLKNNQCTLNTTQQEESVSATYVVPPRTNNVDPVVVRDNRVLYDQLYPPLNRIDAGTHQAMNMQVSNRNMYVPLNDIGDSYRIVGYLTSEEQQPDKGGNSWKMFARQKDRHFADYYIVPTNRNYDIKIHLKDDVVVGTRLRDIYTIPNELRFNSPFLHKTPYTFIENSKTDYSSSYYN